MGEFEILIWVAYGITGLVMFWLLWRTVKELHAAEVAFEGLRNISGASLASNRYIQTSSASIGSGSQASARTAENA